MEKGASDVSVVNMSNSRKVESTGETMKSLRKELYRRKKKNIKKDINAKFNRLILAWCHSDVLTPDFFVSTLAKFDINVEIRDKWIKLPHVSSKFFHSGVIAEFKSTQTAVDAAKELSMITRSVMTIQLSRMLDIIIEAELGHRLCGMSGSRIFVRGLRSLRDVRERRHTVSLLSALGKIQEINFHRETEHLEDGIVCEVTYPYASQAYAAMLYLDGLSVRPELKYRVEVEETLYEEEILQKVKKRMIDLMDENRSVPLRI